MNDEQNNPAPRTKFTLSKDFRFEAAHRLACGYEGKCANLHGHSWNGTLTVGGDTLDDQGMCVDFSVLKEILRRIEDQLDHGLLLHEKDFPIINLCSALELKVALFDANPTSEVIAKFVFELATVMLKGIVQVVSVEIRETCTSACTYHGQ